MSMTQQGTCSSVNTLTLQHFNSLRALKLTIKTSVLQLAKINGWMLLHKEAAFECIPKMSELVVRGLCWLLSFHLCLDPSLDYSRAMTGSFMLLSVPILWGV